MRGPIKSFALRAIFYFSLALSAFWFAGSPAWAQFYVRSPEVEKGVAEVEEHGAVYAGPGEEERLRQSHEAEFKYGLTDRFEGIVEGFFDQAIGESLEAKQFELGGQYEVVRREANGLGLALRTIIVSTSRTIHLTRSCSARLRNK